MFRDARSWLARIADENGWPADQIHDLTVVLSEACSNAVSYTHLTLPTN